VRNTYLRVNAHTLQLSKTRNGGLTSFVGTFGVEDDTYDVALGFVFADSTWMYVTSKGDETVNKEQGFSSKSDAKAALISTLESYAAVAGMTNGR